MRYRDRRWRMVLWLGVLLVWFAASAGPVLAEGRVALVVGNSGYQREARLSNPANDAADMSAALGRLGFEVTTALDVGMNELREALRGFTRRSEGAEVSLVFYAGHGLEMNGENYLVPVDARLERDVDVRFETVPLDEVLASTEGAGLRVVILDACRNNPLARSMQRRSGVRSLSRGSFGELNESLLLDGTVVAYAASAGTTAADGAGRNSPYTAALLAHLEQPLEIGMLFRRVRAHVLESTNERQRPHEYLSLVRDHYLVAPNPSAAEAAVPSATASAGGDAMLQSQQRETLFWESINESSNPADFEAYLAQWPSGVFAPLARNRIPELRAARSRPTPMPAGGRAAEPGRRDPPLRAEAIDANGLGVPSPTERFNAFIAETDQAYAVLTTDYLRRFVVLELEPNRDMRVAYTGGDPRPTFSAQARQLRDASRRRADVLRRQRRRMRDALGDTRAVDEWYRSALQAVDAGFRRLQSVIDNTSSHTGAIKIDANPTDAMVFVDGLRYGTVDDLNDREGRLFPAGRRRIRVAREGYQPFEQTINLGPGERFLIQGSLERSRGR